MTRYYTVLNKEKSLTDNLSSNQVKTTDVNILLNRVRLNKKKNFKKKNIIISFNGWFSQFDKHFFYYLEDKSCLKVY